MRTLFLIIETVLFSTLISGVTIITNTGRINSQIYCDGIACPENSVSCIVSKVTTDDRYQYKYTRTCLDASGIPTANEEELLPNPYPGSVINSFSRVGGGAVSTRSGTLNPNDEKRLKSELEAQRKYWSKWSENFNRNLRASFPPGFPFNNIRASGPPGFSFNNLGPSFPSFPPGFPFN